MSPQRLLTIGVIAAAMFVTACPDRDHCAVAPACEDRQAINCVTSCNFGGPCSTGSHLRDCAEAQTCEVIPGRPQSTRFTAARAVCATSATTCNPDTAPPPRCDFKGSVSGCSGYGREIAVACAQAAVYFATATCCTSGTNPDAGTDAGTSADGGTDGGP